MENWLDRLAAARENGRTLAIRWRSPYPLHRGSVSKWKAVDRVASAPGGVSLKIRDYGSGLNRTSRWLRTEDRPSMFVPEVRELPLDDPGRMVRNPNGGEEGPFPWPVEEWLSRPPRPWTGPPTRPFWIPEDEWRDAEAQLSTDELRSFIRDSWFRWANVGRYETEDPHQGRLFREPDEGDNENDPLGGWVDE